MHLTQIERRRTAHGSSRETDEQALPGHIDPRSLERELQGSIEGEVRFDAGSRALYANDASNYRQVPIGVVVPRQIDDVLTAVAIAHRYGVPILARGGGTSMAGQSCNVALIIDFSKYLHQIIDIDPDGKRARVRPGLVLDDLQAAAAPHGLMFAPDPATHNRCTLGGMIGNNSCGTHSLMGGTTAANVEELDVLTYDGVRMRIGKMRDAVARNAPLEHGRRGRILRDLVAFRDRYAEEIRRRFPDIPRRISGYNLPALLDEHGFDIAKALVGSECTCTLVLEATVRLIDKPPARALLVLGYPDVAHTGDHLLDILEHQPTGLEGMDRVLLDDKRAMKGPVKGAGLLPEGSGWLLVEFGGATQGEADARARRVMEVLRRQAGTPSMTLLSSGHDQEAVWAIRKFGFATANVPGQGIAWTGWEDSAVPPQHVGPYLRRLRALFRKYGYGCTLFGHFGQGCIHTRIDYDFTTKAGIDAFRAFHEEASDLVLSYGGSLSGEHGDGQSVAELLPKMFGVEMMRAFEEFKRIWDPEWKMNPGKVVRPYRMEQNLRLGTEYNPPVLRTHFQYPADEFSFARATLRCVGLGECRSERGGTMCPSYRVTREEEHCTRGRARLLFEMLNGSPIREGWRDPHVADALDLCLACKGCKGDCPVSVDMATYKAEFLSHHYAGRLRPRAAYSMGLIHVWARLAAFAPELANAVTQTPGLSSLVKRVAGISQRRRMPPFARMSFQEWFRRRPARGVGQRVILWPDTFNNFFYPHTAKAAVDVLEALGCDVVVPAGALCCGRPLYDFGMLEMAKWQLRRILDALRDEIAAGTSIVGLEPSCVAVFRDELLNLFPHDLNAKRLAQQTMTLAEFIQHKRPRSVLPRLEARAIVHGHCHHKAIMKFDAEADLFQRLGPEFDILDSGCCGMSGSFGFKEEHYETSLRIGELVLLPAVRRASSDTLIVADGFSCREQIRQTTDRRALHLAELLHLAFEQHRARGLGIARGNGHLGRYPERAYLRRNRVARPGVPLGSTAVLTALVIGGFAVARGRRTA